jgi:hypothetical protein
MAIGRRRLKTLEDLRRYITSVINRLEGGDLDPNVAGRIGYLCNVLKSVMEGGELEKRVVALERQVKEAGINVT